MGDMPSNPHRIAVIAQVRMGSSRLPGKVLKHVQGRSLLAHLAFRVQQATTPFELIIATTEHASDDPIERAAQDLGLRVFRGSENDVLERFRGAAAWVDAEVIVRITGDCPLMDAAELERVLGVFLERYSTEDALDYVTNQAGTIRNIPRGLDVEVFSRHALERAALEATEPGEREHVTPFLYNTPGRFRTLVTHPEHMSLGHLRLTVDTPQDLALIEAVLDELGADADVGAVAELLAARADLLSINQGIAQRGTESEQQQRKARVDSRLLIGRADRSLQMGSGHVARIAALLAAWVQLGGRALLIGTGLEGFWGERLATLGIEVEHGAPGASSLIRRAKHLGAATIAVDGYQFDSQFMADVSEHYPTLWIDDLAETPALAHIILNQNMGFDPARYQVAESTRLLVGEQYVLFRPEFLGAKSEHPRPKHRLVISFGSSDPASMTLPMTRALLSVGPPDLDLVVIAGPGMSDDSRNALIGLTDDRRLTLLSEVNDLAAILRSAPIALVAAGTTTWEALVSGAVPVVIEVAENQAVVSVGLTDRNAGLSLGWFSECEPTASATKILELQDQPQRLQEMIRNGSRLIDGRGVWRVIDALLDAIDQWGAPA